jgi:hypothetical protein
MFAAIREKLSFRNSRPIRKSKPLRSGRLGIEALEERALLSTTPLLFNTIQEGIGDFGNTTAAAKVVQLAPMMETQVQGKLSTGADVDVFKINLQPGQIFTADVDTAASVLIPSRLGAATNYAKVSLLDSAGNPVTTATAGAGRSLEYRVPQSAPANATYYVKLTDSLPTNADAASYTLHLRPIGLADAGDASQLGRAGGALYAFLDGASHTDGSKVLDISGPVGHGFGVRGNWTEGLSYVNGQPAATYTADGILTASGIRVVYLDRNRQA